MNETPHIGMDQLAYFARMMKYYLDPNQSDHFWKRIREYCPDLMQTIDTFDQPEPFRGIRKVTFSWDLHSPAFAPNLVEVYQEDGASDQEKTMNPYTESVKRGAALLDKECPGWRSTLDLSTLDLCLHILGQLFGEYQRGIDALLGIDLRHYESVGEWLESFNHQTVVAHGFSIDFLDPEKDDDAEWQALQEAWRAELDRSTPQQRQQLPAQLEPEQESRI